MQKAIYLASFMMVLPLAACTTAVPVSESGSTQAVEASTAADPIQPPRRYQIPKGGSIPVRTEADFCFTVYGNCSIGFCDGGWNDIQNLSEVCCSNGGCSVEGYWTCGGPCEPTTASCSCSF